MHDFFKGTNMEILSKFFFKKYSKKNSYMITHKHLHSFLELGRDASSLYFLFSECILYLSYTIRNEENMFCIFMLKLIN